MYDYKLLEAFTAVIEHKGFDKAAKALYLTQSAVSQRVRQLEEAFGQILLVRSSPPTPTEAGKEILAHFKKVKLLESELDNNLSSDEQSGFSPVSIALNADSLATWFFDAVTETVKKHKILMNLHVDDQEETHRMLKDGEVSACISTRNSPFQSCTCDYIGTMTYRMFSSPEVYNTYFKDGWDDSTLLNVPVIIYNNKDTLHAQMFETAFGKQPASYPSMLMPDVQKYFDSVCLGMGLGMMPDIQCKEYVKDGLLVDAFAPYKVEAPLYWHRWSLDSGSLDLLTKALTKKPTLL